MKGAWDYMRGVRSKDAARPAADPRPAGPDLPPDAPNVRTGETNLSALVRDDYDPSAPKPVVHQVRESPRPQPLVSSAAAPVDLRTEALALQNEQKEPLRLLKEALEHPVEVADLGGAQVGRLGLLARAALQRMWTPAESERLLSEANTAQTVINQKAEEVRSAFGDVNRLEALNLPVHDRDKAYAQLNDAQSACSEQWVQLIKLKRRLEGIGDFEGKDALLSAIGQNIQQAQRNLAAIRSYLAFDQGKMEPIRDRYRAESSLKTVEGVNALKALGTQSLSEVTDAQLLQDKRASSASVIDGIVAAQAQIRAAPVKVSDDLLLVMQQLQDTHQQLDALSKGRPQKERALIERARNDTRQSLDGLPTAVGGLIRKARFLDKEVVRLRDLASRTHDAEVTKGKLSDVESMLKQTQAAVSQKESEVTESLPNYPKQLAEYEKTLDALIDFYHMPKNMWSDRRKAIIAELQSNIAGLATSLGYDPNDILQKIENAQLETLPKDVADLAKRLLVYQDAGEYGFSDSPLGRRLAQNDQALFSDQAGIREALQQGMRVEVGAKPAGLLNLLKDRRDDMGAYIGELHAKLDAAPADEKTWRARSLFLREHELVQLQTLLEQHDALTQSFVRTASGKKAPSELVNERNRLGQIANELHNRRDDLRAQLDVQQRWINLRHYQNYANSIAYSNAETRAHAKAIERLAREKPKSPDEAAQIQKEQQAEKRALETQSSVFRSQLRRLETLDNNLKSTPDQPQWRTDPYPTVSWVEGLDNALGLDHPDYRPLPRDLVMDRQLALNGLDSIVQAYSKTLSQLFGANAGVAGAQKMLGELAQVHLSAATPSEKEAQLDQKAREAPNGPVALVWQGMKDLRRFAMTHPESAAALAADMAHTYSILSQSGGTVGEFISNVMTRREWQDMVSDLVLGKREPLYSGKDIEALPAATLALLHLAGWAPYLAGGAKGAAEQNLGGFLGGWLGGGLSAIGMPGGSSLRAVGAALGGVAQVGLEKKSAEAMSRDMEVYVNAARSGLSAMHRDGFAGFVKSAGSYVIAREALRTLGTSLRDLDETSLNQMVQDWLKSVSTPTGAAKEVAKSGAATVAGTAVGVATLATVGTMTGGVGLIPILVLAALAGGGSAAATRWSVLPALGNLWDYATKSAAQRQSERLKVTAARLKQFAQAELTSSIQSQASSLANNSGSPSEANVLADQSAKAIVNAIDALGPSDFAAIEQKQGQKAQIAEMLARAGARLDQNRKAERDAGFMKARTHLDPDLQQALSSNDLPLDQVLAAFDNSTQALIVPASSSAAAAS